MLKSVLESFVAPVLAVLFLGLGCTSSDPILPLPDELDSGLPPSSEDMAAPPAEDLPKPPPDLTSSASGCSGKPMKPPGTTSLMMMSGGKQRTYFLHVP